MELIGFVKNVAVIGAGTMGHGIAEVAALAGYEVWMYDIDQEILNNAVGKIRWSVDKLASKRMVREATEDVMGRIHPTLDFHDAVRDADFVIEAVPEEIELKKKIFHDLDRSTPEHTILATNTSSLPITEIASATERSDRVVGMHFFNPPPLMPLVEVIRGKETSGLTVRIAYELAKKFGKQVVIVNKDVPGFVVNRILGKVFMSACEIVVRGEATIEEIDSAARYRLGFPMGIFELLDYVGIDVHRHVEMAMARRGFDISCSLIEEKYKAGEYGVKTGKGFYTYPEPRKYVKPKLPKEASEDVDIITLIAPAVNEAAWLIREGVATRDDIDKGVVLGLNYPKGILRYADEYGIDEIVKRLQKRYEETKRDAYKPNPLLEDMVKAGKLGMKSGEGFYVYPEAEEESIGKVLIRYEKPIAWVYLNRPEKLNALNPEVLENLSDALDKIEEMEDIRVVVISGIGRAFCAGADITGFLDRTPFKEVFMSRRFQDITNKIEYYVKPVIMMINGFCLGGGLEVAMAGDFRIASELATLGQPEINLGIIPGGAGTQRLARLVGIAKAKELIYTGDMIPALEAYKIGLVDKVVPPEKLEEETRKFALKLAEKPPLALLAAKYAIQLGLEADIWHGQATESILAGLVYSTGDMKEGVKAFLEKRKPEFKGK